MTTLTGSRIRHTVSFALKHLPGSAQESSFLEAAAALASLPGVEQFESLRQTSTKNAFAHGLSMEFADQAAYDRYNTHPDHVAFVQGRWIPEVVDFMEIDFASSPMTDS